MGEKFNLIAIYGPSGCGKDTIKRAILKKDKVLFNNIIGATTRPKREKEINGKDYYFMSNEEFTENILNCNMMEAASFNGWFYGTLRTSLILNKINIGIFNMEALQTLLEDYEELNILPVWISVNDKERLIRTLNREKNPNCTEICRRFIADYNDYYIIPNSISVDNNEKGKVSENAEYIIQYAKDYFNHK